MPDQMLGGRTDAGTYESASESKTRQPSIGSMCSGYGGLELGLMAVVGGTVAWHAENDLRPAQVLAARFSGVPNHGDIKTTDWTAVEPVDWLAIGYPCQPDSLAGKGLSENDERWIWPDIARAVGVLRPRHLLLENVPGHFVRGFRTVLGSLATLGYDARWILVRASDAGAPHRRERLFVVASDDAERRSSPADADMGGPQSVGREFDQRCDTDRRGSADIAWGDYEPAIRRWERILGRPAPEPTVDNGRGGRRLNPRLNEWMMGLPDGWVTDVLPRNPALKCIGNGVVPQQAALAVRALLSAEAVAA